MINYYARIEHQGETHGTEAILGAKYFVATLHSIRGMDTSLGIIWTKRVTVSPALCS
jgi:hypothetical protein